MYTTARILIFAVSVMVLYFAGARGLLLLGLALVISALGSYILLNKQRQVIAGKLNNRVARTTAKASGRVADFRERLEEGSRAEDAERAEAAGVTTGENDAAAEPAEAAGPAADEPVR
jgi:Protein of unknown function (DUF4229)